MKLYVGNIPFAATEEDIRGFFAPISLGEVVICRDRQTGHPRGFAFVRVLDPGEAARCIESLSGGDLGGRRVLVSEAVEKPREDRGEKRKGEGPERGREDRGRRSRQVARRERKGGAR